MVGNTAVISGVITKSNTGLEGNTGVFAVQDNGEGANAAPDRLSLVFFYGPQYAGANRQCTASRTRGDVLSFNESAADGGLTQTRTSPEKPGRFTNV